jgi:transposase
MPPCSGCGSELDDSTKTLGEGVMEELEYLPGRFVVNRIIHPRLSCAACDTIFQVPMPSRPVPKSYAGPGLLASVIVNKYADHLPPYRQTQSMAREGIDIDRSTLADWGGAQRASAGAIIR